MENRFVEIRAGGVTLPGSLTLPVDAHGMVIFLHALGSGRLNPHSQYIGRYLEKAGFGTLAFDLLTLSEMQIDQATGTLRTDIDLLSGRTLDTIRWLMLQDFADDIQLAFFGDGAGGAAAIVAAIQKNDITHAVVCLDGQLNLAEDYLGQLSTPILSIVREEDEELARINRKALDLIRQEVQKKLETIPGKDTKWQNPGMMDQVVRLTVDWFSQYLAPRGEL